MKKKESEVIYPNFQQIMASEKLILLGKLASGIAHEINNPVMIIQNYTSLLLDEFSELSGHNHDILEQHREYIDYLKEITRECDRISTFTKSLLSFSRPSNLKPQIVEIEKVLLSALQLMNPLIVKSGVSANLKSEATKSYCLIKIDEIQQVFVNIIDNALFALKKKYPERESLLKQKYINVSVKNINIEEDNVEREYILIEFLDDGIGISKKAQKRIFEPFFSTKKSKESLPEQDKHQGLGLGLSYCQTIVQNNHGMINFESKENEYSKFMIHLPVTENPNDLDKGLDQIAPENKKDDLDEEIVF